MGALLKKLHREHVQRQQRWFPPPEPEAAVVSAPAPAPPKPVELELHRLVRRAERIELQFADRWPLAEFLPPRERPAVRVVQRIVADFYGVERADLLSQRRTQNFVRPRQVAMYLAAKFARRSLPELGRQFGGRDHTTVLHALRKIEALRAGDERLRDELSLLIMRICEATGYHLEEDA
jgi:chromosomal replication initiator protein